MNRRCGILAVAVITSLALTGPAYSAGGRGGGGRGQSTQDQMRSTNQIQEQERVRDGSCDQTGTPRGAKNKRGNTYGPGDGAGNQGEGPKDGTGYGAPTNP